MKILLSIPLFLAIVVVSACNQSETNNTVIQRDTIIKIDTVVTTKQIESDNDDDFTNRSKKAIDNLDRKMDSLETRWKEGKGERKTEYAEKREDLKRRSKELRARLDSNREKSGERWEQFKNEVDRDMDDLEKRIDNLFDNDKK